MNARILHISSTSLRLDISLTSATKKKSCRETAGLYYFQTILTFFNIKGRKTRTGNSSVKNILLENGFLLSNINYLKFENLNQVYEKDGITFALCSDLYVGSA